MPPTPTLPCASRSRFGCPPDGGPGRLRTVGCLARLALVLAASCLCLVVSRAAFAHEGPEHAIEELTALLAERGDSAELRVDRAVEYSILGRTAEARRDLEQALRLDPASLPASRELARLQFRTGSPAEALETVSRALAGKGGDPVEQGSLHILRAEILLSLNRLSPALDDCQAAIRRHPSQPEWYLLRSELQRRLKRNRSRIAGLEDGLARTGSGLLMVERIEALLDAGRFRTALKAIEPELASSRVRCRWLVRRGRARLGLGETEPGREDLRDALGEIETLLDPKHPDPSLLLDQAAAHTLLGDGEAAERSLRSARDHGAQPEAVRRIETLTGRGQDDHAAGVTGRSRQ